MGKYIRHGIAGVISFLLTSLLITLLNLNIDPGVITNFAEAVSVAATPGVMVILYAWLEKFLKRFKWLDAQGWLDRLWLNSEARQLPQDKRGL